MGDETVLNNLVVMGQQVLSYEFFALLSEEIEKKLLDTSETLQEQSQAIMQRAGETLQTLLQAPDRRAAVREHMDDIDDAFMYVLSANIQELEKRGQGEEAQILREVHEYIMDEMENQAPPEVRLLNRLIRTQDREGRQAILAENPDMATPELKQVIQALIGDAESAGEETLVSHLNEILELLDGMGQGASPSILIP